ncbi:MAG: PilZ domain-containing protein [Myxococcota bacterium]
MASFDATEHHLLEPALESLEIRPCYQRSRAALFDAVKRRKWDGLLVDWDDPRVQGETLVRTVRDSPSNAAIPVVVLTGDPSTLGVARACRAGADLFLSRPLGARALFRGLRVIYDAMVEEKRRYQRVETLERCTVVHGSRAVPGELLNLSASGALARLEHVPALQSSVILELSDPELKVPAWIVRHHQDQTVGLRFIWVDGELEESLKQRVEHSIEDPRRAPTRNLGPST